MMALRPIRPTPAVLVSDDHADKAHKGVAQGSHLNGKVRVKVAKEGTGDHGDQDLDVKGF